MLFPLMIDEDSKKKRKDGKGRRFTAQLLSYLIDEALAPANCPVFMAVAAPFTTLNAWLANYRSGARAATPRSMTFRQAREVSMRCRQERRPEGAVALLWSTAFELEPDPLHAMTGRIEFVAMPRLDWLTAQARHRDGNEHATRAALFCAYLARRTDLPIAADSSFQVQLYEAAFDESWTSEPRLQGDIGYASPVTCSVDAKTFEEFLIAQTEAFYGQTEAAPLLAAAH